MVVAPIDEQRAAWPVDEVFITDLYFRLDGGDKLQSSTTSRKHFRYISGFTVPPWMRNWMWTELLARP